MNRKMLFGFVLVILVLSSCNPGETSPILPAPMQTDVPVSVTTPTPAPVNLALNKDVTASKLLLKELPVNALDGNLETQWGAGDAAPQWIQIDLQSFATVTGFRLTIAQSPDGQTTHQIFAGASLSDLKLVHEFGGSTSENQTLEFTFDEPLTGIRYVKVLTTESPSWVAWKEIEVFGEVDSAMPTPRPESQVANLIYHNGQIITMEKDNPTAEAIAIKGDKILAVGSSSDVMALQGDQTKLIDLNGLTLTPGFIDSHAHRIGDRWHFGLITLQSHYIG